MTASEIARFVAEGLALTILGWVANSISTWRYTSKVQRGSFPSRAAHFIHGIAKQLDKEDS